ANSRRLRRAVVKQLSNLSIDEVSLVDRGANQHALISIAKRAPQADDYFDDVEKMTFGNAARLGTASAQSLGRVAHGGAVRAAHHVAEHGEDAARVVGANAQQMGRV